MSNSTVFLYYFFLPDLDWDASDWMMELPASLQKKVMAYKRKADRNLVLMGKILLKHALKKLGSNTSLEGIQYTALGKPYLPNGPHFNISHSGNLVVVAVSNQWILGVDTEEIQEVKLDDFKSFMRSDEWMEIQGANFPLEAFFHFWCQKEAVLKITGKGLSLPLKEIWLQTGLAKTSDEIFSLKQIQIHENYPCYLAVAQKDVMVQVEEFEILTQ